MTAVELHEKGNTYFQAGKLEEAVLCYRDALAQVRLQETQGGNSSSVHDLGQALRLNLGSGLLRLQRDRNEVVTLCTEALLGDPDCARALYQRGSAGRCLASTQRDAGKSRETLQAAQRDALQAAKLAPTDGNIQALLEEVTKELLAASPASAFAEEGPLVCSTCGREGHRRCGKALWIEQRALWLKCSEKDAGGEPGDFEKHGPLMQLLRESRNERSRIGEAAGYRSRDSEASLSDDEREMLEDCLESTARPYPRLKRGIALAQAVQVAEDLWDDD